MRLVCEGIGSVSPYFLLAGIWYLVFRILCWVGLLAPF